VTKSISKIYLCTMLFLICSCSTLSKEDIKEFPVTPLKCDAAEMSKVSNLKLSHLQGVQVNFEREVVKIEDQYYWMSSYRPFMACVDAQMPSKFSERIREFEKAEQQKAAIYLSLYGAAIGTLVTVPGGAVIAGTIPVGTAYIYDLVMGNKHVELQKLVDQYNAVLAEKLIEK